jgi:hypothetical protein
MIFLFTEAKRVFDEYPVSVDFTTWLEGETISGTPVYSAVRTDTGADATAIVLDAAKHTNTETVAKPWIKGGALNVWYEVIVGITTNTGAKKEVHIRFVVR